MTTDPLKLAFEIGSSDRIKFDWPNSQSVMGKVLEEIQELKESLTLDRFSQAHELGDVFFTLVQLARHLDLDPSLSLEIACQRYLDRMKDVRNQISNQKLNFDSLTLEELEVYWKKAKHNLKSKEAQILSDSFKLK